MATDSLTTFTQEGVPTTVSHYAEIIGARRRGPLPGMEGLTQTFGLSYIELMLSWTRVILESLRAIAALAVCWFHLTNAQFTEHFDAYVTTGKYGWLGVQVFFVVSGFVIPYSMLAGG